MGKKAHYIIFAILLNILLISNVYAADYTCEYDLTLTPNSGGGVYGTYAKVALEVTNGKTTLKIVKDETNVFEIIPYSSGTNYNLINTQTFSMKSHGNTGNYQISYNGVDSTATIIANTGSCPIARYDSSTYIVSFDSECIESGYGDYCTKSKSTLNDQPTIVNQCTKSVTSNTIEAVSGVEFSFITYSNGLRQFCARMKNKNSPSCVYLNSNGYASVQHNERTFTIEPTTSSIIFDSSAFCKSNIYLYETSGIAIGDYIITTSKEEAEQGTANSETKDGSLAENGDGDDFEQGLLPIEPYDPPNLNLEDITCESIFYDGDEFNDFGQLLQDIFLFIKVLAPILLIALSSLDYIKAIASKDADELKKANERFIKRLIAAVALFLLPFILDFVFDIFGVYDMQTCGIK